MKVRYLLSIATLMALAGAAYAGFVQPAPVIVDLDSRSALGDQLTARVSANDVEFIGCGTRIIDDGMGGTFSFGFCQATDALGVNGFCSTTNPNLIDAMHATSAYAFIIFSWNELDECTRVGFSTQSFYLPDKKAK